MFKNIKNNRVFHLGGMLVVILVIGLSIYNLLTSREDTALEKMIKDTFQMVEYHVIKKPILFFDKLASEVEEVHNVYEENKILKEKLDDYAKTQARVDVLQNEIELLKNELDYTSIPTDYKTKNGYIISRDVESWSAEIQISLGDQDGIKKNMAVVDAKGMIGYVSSVNGLTSNVTLLTYEKSVKQIPIVVTDNEGAEVFGLLKGYDSNNGNFIIEMFNNVTLQEGTMIYTSGLGGDIPKGITIGTIISSNVASNQVNTTIKAKPAANFDSLQYISVIQRGDDHE